MTAGVLEDPYISVFVSDEKQRHAQKLDRLRIAFFRNISGDRNA